MYFSGCFIILHYTDAYTQKYYPNVKHRYRHNVHNNNNNNNNNKNKNKKSNSAPPIVHILLFGNNVNFILFYYKDNNNIKNVFLYFIFI